MARTVLLAAHGFVLSAHTMVDDEVTEEDLDAELRTSPSGHPAMTALVTGRTARRITAGPRRAPDRTVDLLVIGLGVTGAGVALDAATRGLDRGRRRRPRPRLRHLPVVVQAGARRAALPRHGQLGVAHESAVERGILMEVTAPHLTRALPMLIPLSRG